MLQGLISGVPRKVPAYAVAKGRPSPNNGQSGTHNDILSILLCNFVKMIVVKRRWFAAMLLSVILPMALVAPFHHHHDYPDSESRCQDCLEHRPHQGHLSNNNSTDECLICQFLAQMFVPSEGLFLKRFSSGHRTLASIVRDQVLTQYHSLSSPRAPPVSF